MNDPRGPERTIVAVAYGTGPTILTLSCGHDVERVNHFSYRVSDPSRCFTCRQSAKESLS